MTSYQRVKTALALLPTDYVPVMPQIIQHALQFSDVHHSSYSQDGKVMADTIMSAQKYYGYDGIYVSTDNYIIAEAMGGSVRFLQDEPPQLLSHPLSTDSPEDISKLKKFSLENGRMSVVLKATNLCRKQLKNEVFIKTNIDSAPFSAAASIRGSQEFLTNLFDDAPIIAPLLKFCTQFIIQYGLEAASAGAHGLAFGDSVSGLVNRDMYRKYALPYAQKAIRTLKEETGLPVFYHVCGDSSHLIDLLVETGADCIEVDSLVSMKDIYPLVKDSCCVMGNVSTVTTMLNGTVADVQAEASDILSIFQNKGGLLLSSACEVPRNTPRENVMALVTASREFQYK